MRFPPAAESPADAAAIFHNNAGLVNGSAVARHG